VGTRFGAIEDSPLWSSSDLLRDNGAVAIAQ
jgi:hypothetical protein